MFALMASLVAAPLLAASLAAVAPPQAAATVVLREQDRDVASGVFVSKDGLIWTTTEALAACNNGGIDTREIGFVARSQEEERRCPMLSWVVTGQTAVQDVRLVFAPEAAVSELGGASSRTSYPRATLDVVLLRAYANDKPAAVGFMPVSTAALRDGVAVTVGASSGAVRGLVSDGHRIRWASQIGDLYILNKRNNKAVPYALPARFEDAIGRVDFSVPLDFAVDAPPAARGTAVTSADGSLVGVLLGVTIGDAPVGGRGDRRIVVLAAGGLLHALDRVYGQKPVVDEILASARFKTGEK